MNLRTKLAFALVAAALLSMGALGSFTYLWAEDLFQRDFHRQLAALAESETIALRDVVGDWKGEVRGLVQKTGLPDLAAAALEDPGSTAISAVVRVLENATASSEGLLEVTLVDSRGNRLFGDAPLDPEADSTLADAEVAFSGVRIAPDQSIRVVFHAWVSHDDQRVALLEAVFRTEALHGVVGPTTEFGRGAETLLVLPAAPERDPPSGGGDGYFVVTLRGDPAEAGPALQSLSNAPPSVAAALGGREEVFPVATDWQGRRVVAATRGLPELGWGVVVQVEVAEAVERSDWLLANMRDLGLALAAFAILGGTLLGFHLSRPIHKLVQEVDRIRHGELGLRLDVKGEDEVAFLAQSLNEFMDQLDRSSDLFQLGELNVLLVNADAQRGPILCELLQNWNMRPTLAGSGTAAAAEIARASREGRPFQLILLDDATPETHGTGWVEELRGSGWDPCPIVLLVSSAEALDALDATELAKAGIGQVLPKPVVASHLMEAILDEMGVSADGLASTADVLLKKTSPRKILLVEDSRLIQRVMIGFLENWGHQVSLAENGRLAVELTRAEDFDLILMDVEMPEMNGLEATAAIRENERESGRRTPIIALTAEALAEDRDRCLAAGMDEYLAKPADPKILYGLIQKCPAQMLASVPTGDGPEV